MRYATGVVVEAVESRILFAVNPSVVDLLVAYTPQALQAVGSQAKMVNKIDRAIADVDQTLSNSEVNVSYRIVDIMETAYNDTANTQTDFAAEPTIPDVAAARQKYGADVVDLITGGTMSNGADSAPAYAWGEANQPDNPVPPVPSQGYALEWIGDMNGALSIHELGHVLGGGHAYSSVEAAHTVPYTHEQAVTVEGQAYAEGIDDTDPSVGEIEYYSNPNVYFRGVATGVADNLPNPTDNAEEMNNSGSKVAAYLPTLTPETTGPLAGLGPVTNVPGQQTISFTVIYYDQGGVDTTSLGGGNVTVTGPNNFRAAATFNGIVVDGNLTPVGASTFNEPVIYANYTVNVGAAVGTLSAYSFALNASQVKNVVGIAATAGPIGNSSGDNPNNTTPNLLPRYAGSSNGEAAELGDIAGKNIVLNDFTGPYFINPAYTFPDEDTYHFTVSSASVIQANVTSPFVLTVTNQTAQIMPTSTNTWTLQPGDYYISVQTPYLGGTSPFGPGGNFTLSLQASGNGVAAPPASISGTVFIDKNNDGTVDMGDPGLPNVAVHLTGTDTNGMPYAATVMTDANGNYTFNNITPSGMTGYTLQIDQPAGYKPSTNGIGALGGTALPNNAPGESGIVITPGATGPGYTFGEQQPQALASLSGSVFVDTQNTGMPGGGNMGLAGDTITLTGTDYLNNPVNLTVQTDANGNFTFNNISPGGIYTLTETEVPGYIDGATTVGVPTDGYNSNPGVDMSIPINAGASLTGFYFAKQPVPAGATAPAAIPAQFTGQQGGTVTGNVLTNDIVGTPATQMTATANAVSITRAISTPTMGAMLMTDPKDALNFTLNYDGTFSYTPVPGFSGADSFTYECVNMSDGQCSNIAATVTIKVTAVDQPPTPNTENPRIAYITQGQDAKVDLRTLVEDSDTPVDQLKFAVGPATGGVISLLSDGHTAIFSPNADFVGDATFEFTANDGHTTSAPIMFDVEVAPTGVATLVVRNDAVGAFQGVPVTANVLSGVSDSNPNATYTVSIASGPSHGTAKIVNNKVVYTPSIGNFASDSLVFKVKDSDGVSDTATLTIDIRSGVTVSPDPANPGKTALDIVGTNGNDVINVKPGASGSFVVWMNKADVGSFTCTGNIYISGLGGNDTLSIDPSITRTAMIFAGQNTDVLSAGGGPTILVGGPGHDVLIGGPGRDILIAGSGAAVLHGGSGDDILVGAGVTFDTNLYALGLLLQEWSRTDKTFQQRVAHIRTGGGLNGSYLLKSSTLQNSHAHVTMLRGTGNTLFFVNSNSVSNPASTDVKVSI